MRQKGVSVWNGAAQPLASEPCEFPDVPVPVRPTPGCHQDRVSPKAPGSHRTLALKSILWPQIPT